MFVSYTMKYFCLVIQAFRKAMITCLNIPIICLTFTIFRKEEPVLVQSSQNTCILFDFHSHSIAMALLCMYTNTFKYSTLKLLI